MKIYQQKLFFYITFEQVEYKRVLWKYLAENLHEHSVYPLFFRKGGLTGFQFSEGVCWEWRARGGGVQVLHKNKLKSEIFNDKKSLETNMFFSTITKNLNWKILTQNLLDSFQI